MDTEAFQPAEDRKQESIQITYEILFEILRIEKNNEELQKLDSSFFFNTVAYLNEKSAILTSQKAQKTMFADEEQEKTELQLRNIKRILQELYDRRERKILNMAVNKAKIRTNIVDTSSLMDEERLMFDQMVNCLERYRVGILANILSYRLPNIAEEPKREEANNSGNSGKETFNPLSTTSRLVRILKPVPRFVGKELEQYGPFEEEDIANLPSEIADVLIEKERAEEIKE